MVLWLGQGEREAVYPLLGALLAAEFGLAALPTIARTPAGKPFFPSAPHLYFNVSHSDTLLLCGAGDTPHGVDIERVRPRRGTLPQHVLSPAEHRWYMARGCRWADFYTLWTLKESRVKCEGSGLRQPARTIHIPLLEVGECGMLDGYCFRAYGGEDWRGAVCAQNQVLPDIVPIS